MTDKVALNAAYDRILEEARLKIALARQHLEDLAEFGLNEDWLQALSAIADGAEEMPSPARQIGELKSLTAARDAALGACVQWVRKLRLRLQLAFDQQPPSGMQFPAQDWRAAQRNEGQAIALLPSLIEIARQYRQELAQVGQSDATLSEGETLLARLKAASEAHKQYRFSRMAVTAQRRAAFRSLYDGVNRINRIGQMVYGPNSPQGQLFRNHWQFRPARRHSPALPTPLTEIVEASGDRRDQN